MSDVDHADAEVKGISRYIPTLLSKTILLVLPGAAWFSFSAVREHPEWFLIDALSNLEKTLIAALIASCLLMLLILVLVLDMAFAIHHSKHRRIVHYSQQHPLMSVRWLASNATVAHWLGLGVICAACFVAGYLYASP